MTDTPPDWVLIEAANRFGWNDVSEYVRAYYATNDPPGYRALCDMILKHEQPPIDAGQPWLRTYDAHLK